MLRKRILTVVLVLALAASSALAVWSYDILDQKKNMQTPQQSTMQAIAQGEGAESSDG